jgi:protein TonB
MSAPYQRHGSYVLLRELAQDDLGSIHRAGLVTGGSIGDLVLFRRLPAQVVRAVETAIDSRRDLSGQLRSPFLGELRDGGTADGAPFLAYEYRPGVTGAQLLSLADQRMSPLAPELATVVADRAAQALLAVWGARSGPALLVPELLWISTEGEVRLLGVEAAPGLRALAAGLPALSPYLAPEARGGDGPAVEADEVWALGALLTALLTGKAPPSDPDEGGVWLANAMLAEDEVPLPEPLADLLGRTLVPRSQRLAKIEAWQKALSRAVEMIGWRTSPFQLAVFMHSLCKAEMAREPRDVERERAEALRPRAEASAAATSPPPQPPAAAPAPIPFEVAPPGMSAFATDDESQGGKKKLLVAAAAVVVLVLGGGAWWLLGDRGAVEEPPAAAVTTVPQPTSAPAPTVAGPAAPSPVELEQRLAALMAEREKSLSAHYSQEIEQLRSQLEDSRRQEPVRPAATAPPRPPPSRMEPLPERPATQPVTMPGTTAQPAAAAPPQAPPQAPAPAPAPAPASPQAAAPAGAPDESAPFVPAKLLQFDPPEYPLPARRQRVEGTVIVSLRVDPAGRVGEVRFLRKVAQEVGINEAAAKAARAARFSPATRGGTPVESWYTLTIPFQL